ncbi:MAG: tRNA pseudouridine(13) synthase TruD [Thermoplasmata archaeon]|nr:MAG: tRNA pseudouridine(13) synthase TruD [Thermoplasmata archaeon]
MEESIGISVYLTKGEGIKGKIKEKAEDFLVEEVSVYPKPSKGKHVVARIESKNWETNKLIENLARVIKTSPKAIGYAGIKDKRAVSIQLMSFASPLQRILNAGLRDVKIEPLYITNKPLMRGMLYGNKFNTWIRNVENVSSFYKILKEIEEYGGFPNFFGVQRFGIARPITHIVGKYLIENDIEKAVMTYIAEPFEGEDEESYKARKFLMETHDFEEALKIYPKKLNFERRIIEHLSKHPNDWENALKKLPSNLIRIFVHAYQSYLFNKILSMRIKRGLPINEAIIGDIVIKDVSANEGTYVNEKNERRVNKEMKKGKCFVSGAIIGYATNLAEGEMGEIESKVMEEEGVEAAKFKMPYMPWLASPGMRRSLFVPLKNMKWKIDGNSVFLQFFLPKGCYATSLLREFMKADIYSY